MAAEETPVTRPRPDSSREPTSWVTFLNPRAHLWRSGSHRSRVLRTKGERSGRPPGTGQSHRPGPGLGLVIGRGTATTRIWTRRSRRCSDTGRGRRSSDSDYSYRWRRAAFTPGPDGARDPNPLLRTRSDPGSDEPLAPGSSAEARLGSRAIQSLGVIHNPVIPGAG